MVALALFGLVFIGCCFGVIARRAIPVCAAAVGAWAGAHFRLDWIACVAIAAATLTLVALTLDLLSAEPTTWRFVATAEVVAAGLLMALLGYAIFGSSGVKGLALVICICATALIGMGCSARFRTFEIV